MLLHQPERQIGTSVYMDAGWNNNPHAPPLLLGMKFLSKWSVSEKNLPIDLFTWIVFIQIRLFYPLLASQLQIYQLPSKMSLKAEVCIERQHCYLSSPAVVSALCGMPVISSDVTSSLHSVSIPLASSLFSCHATLVPCYTGTGCILGIFLIPLHVAWGWEEL